MCSNIKMKLHSAHSTKLVKTKQNPRSILDKYVKPPESYVTHHSLHAFHHLEMLPNIGHVLSWGTLCLGSTYQGYILPRFSIPPGDLKLEGVY